MTGDDFVKLNKTQHKIYDVVMSVLAIAAVLLVLIDLSQGLNGWQKRLDQIILFIFTVDYVVRFVLAPKKAAFMKANICDLIAIIPFYTVFRMFKIAALARFGIYAKLPRAFAFLYRPLRKAQRFFNTNGFKYVVFITTIMIAVGGILIHFAEGMSYSDGIWWAFVTTTTVGYGDISPTTFYGRIIAMVLMLLGIGLLGTITSTLTSYFLKTGTGSVRNDALESIRTQLDHFDELSEQDVEDICRILLALKKKELPVAQHRRSGLS